MNLILMIMKKSIHIQRKAIAITIISSMLLLTGIMIPFEKAKICYHKYRYNGT